MALGIPGQLMWGPLRMNVLGQNSERRNQRWYLHPVMAWCGNRASLNLDWHGGDLVTSTCCLRVQRVLRLFLSPGLLPFITFLSHWMLRQMQLLLTGGPRIRGILPLISMGTSVGLYVVKPSSFRVLNSTHLPPR